MLRFIPAETPKKTPVRRPLAQMLFIFLTSPGPLFR